MGQSSASAPSLRNGKNESGFAEYSKIQTNQPEASWRMAGNKPTYAGRKKQRLETVFPGHVSQTISWEVRCTGLNMPAWERRAGPADAFRMARQMAEFIDHDLARPIAFGGKKIELELRLPGRDEIHRFMVDGSIEYRYSAYKIV